MRGTRAQKAETRQRILETAGRLFSQHGIDAVGVDAVMRAAGLTHGGFYGHFPSKEVLVAEVAAASLARSAAWWERLSAEHPPEHALGRIVGAYLDPAHVANPEAGCMLTTLGQEVARRPEARPAIVASVRTMVAALERCGAGGEPGAYAALSTMVGAVVLARLADSPDLVETILAAARGHIPGAPSQGMPPAVSDDVETDSDPPNR